MKIPTTPRTLKARRAIVIGALSVLTLGGFGAAFATSAGAATPTPSPGSTTSTTSTIAPAFPAVPATESTSAKDTDTLQQGDQTGPDSTTDGESPTK